MKSPITRLLLSLAIIFTVSCQSKHKAEREQSTVPTKDCYAYTSATDTIQLSLVRTDTGVTGNLLYQLAEKDRNTGSLSGQMLGDTLLAEYRFQSEGVESVREVVFLLRNDSVIEGYGPMAEEAGKTIFKPQSRITFSEQFPLTKTDCD